MTTLSAKLTFYIPEAQSLKDKRMVTRSILDKTRHNFNAAIAEVDTQDIHQNLTIGVAVVSGEYGHAQTVLDEIIRYIEEHVDAELIEVSDT
jgi:uncharacterized protein YlxP (DUF503 family)